MAVYVSAMGQDGNRTTGRRIAITGASGLIGTALRARLGDRHQVIRMVRRPPRAGERQWDPQAGRLDAALFSDIDVVIHLGGESIAGGRWSASRQRAIRQSRVRGTETIVNGIQAASPRPAALVSASAVGFYGDRGDLVLDETNGPGTGFLPEVAVAWERAADPASEIGVRVVHPRFGIVLSPRGGALAAMLPPFRLGLGGRLGSGRQWMSWIALDDCVAAIEHLVDSSLAGPVNLVAPESIRNAAFTKTLGEVLDRPALLAVPSCLLRLALGRLADEGLLASTRVVPARLQHDGFRWRFPTLAAALRHELGRER